MKAGSLSVPNLASGYYRVVYDAAGGAATGHVSTLPKFLQDYRPYPPAVFDCGVGGIGAALVADAEERARELGATRLELSSAQRLARAHAIWQRLGYSATGSRFVK